MADNMTLDANELRTVADEISGYCARQREILNVYYAQMMALEDSWKDDKTFGTVIEEIRLLRSSVTSIIDTVNNTYPKYFRKKADNIDNRPTFNNQTIHTTRIIEEVRVPYTSTSYYTPSPVSHINPQLFATPSNATYTPSYSACPTTHYRDTIDSAIRDTYSSAPDTIKDSFRRNVGDLSICASKEGGCYYDPCSVSNPTQHSKIAAIDLKTNNISEQLATVVSQHLFYNCGKENNNLLINSIAKESKYATTEEAQNIVARLKQSINIPEGQTEDEYLHSNEYAVGSNFFTLCYKSYLTKDREMVELIDKYFPNSVAIFKELIKNDGSLNDTYGR